MATKAKNPVTALVLAGLCAGLPVAASASPMADESALVYRRFRGADEVSGSDRGKDRDRGSQGRESSGSGDKSSKPRGGGGGGGKSDDQIGR